MFFFYWVGLFLLVDSLCYLLFRRPGNDLQLFASLSFAALPLAIFPYIYMIIPATMSRYVLLVLQVWTVLLFSSALSFGKGLRLYLFNSPESHHSVFQHRLVDPSRATCLKSSRFMEQFYGEIRVLSKRFG